MPAVVMVESRRNAGGQCGDGLGGGHGVLLELTGNGAAYQRAYD